MKVQCPRCRAVYDVSKEKIIEEKGKFRCLKCGLLFDVEIPQDTGTPPLIHKIPSELKDSYQKAGRGELGEMLRLCKELLKKGDYELVIDICKQFMNLYSSKPAVMMSLGEAYTGKGMFGEAEEVFRKIYERYPDNLKATRGLGIALFSGGKKEEARKILEKYLANNPGDEEVKRIVSALEEEKEEAGEREEVKAPEKGEKEKEEEYLSFGEISLGMEEGKKEEEIEEVKKDLLPEELDLKFPEEEKGAENLPEEVEGEALKEVLEEFKEEEQKEEEEVSFGELEDETRVEFSSVEKEFDLKVEREEEEIREEVEREEEEISEETEGAFEFRVEEEIPEKKELKPEEEVMEESGEEVLEEEKEFVEEEFVGREGLEEEKELVEEEFVSEEISQGPEAEVEEETVEEKKPQADELKSLEEELSSLLKSEEEEKIPPSEKMEEITFEDFAIEEEEEEEEKEVAPPRKKLFLPVFLTFISLLLLGAGTIYFFTFEYSGSAKNLTGQKILYLSRGFFKESEGKVKGARNAVKSVEEEIMNGGNDIEKYEKILLSAAAQAPHEKEVLFAFLNMSLLNNLLNRRGAYSWQVDLLDSLSEEKKSSSYKLASSFIHLIKGDYQGLKNTLKESAHLFTPFDEVLLLYGMYSAQLYDEIINLVNKKEESGGRVHHLLMFYKFLSLYRLNRKEEAVEYGRKFVGLYPENKSSRIKLAMIYARDYGDTSGAEMLLPDEKGIGSADLVDYYLTRMMIAWKKGNLNEAIAAGEEGVKKTGSPLIKSELLKLYEEAGSTDKLISLAKSLLNDPENKFLALQTLGQVSLKSGEYEEAVKYFSIYLAERESEDIRTQYARSLLLSKRFNEALNAVQEVMRRKPEDPNIKLVYAQIKIESAQGEALEEIEKIARMSLTRNPLDGEARLLLAKVLLKKEKKSDALSECSYILKAGVVPYPGLYLELAEIFDKAGDTDGAILSVQKYLSEVPESRSGTLRLADLYEKNNNYREAVKVYSSYLSRWGESVEVLKRAGNSSILAGDLKEARNFLERASRINPGDPEIYEKLGEVNSREGELELAVVNFQKATGINPNYAEAHYNLSKIFSKTGNSERALYHSEKAYNLQPDNDDYLIMYANSLFSSGRISEAQKLLQGNEERIKKRKDFYLLTGEIRSTLGDFEGAERVLSEGSKIFPDDPEVLVALARVKLLQEDLSRSKTLLFKALKIKPSSHAYFLLGKVYMEEGNLEESYAYFARAIGLDKNFAEAYYSAGVVLKKLSRYKEAREYLTRAISLGLPRDLEEMARRELSKLK